MTSSSIEEALRGATTEESFRAGVAVMFNQPVPAGWVEVQRDDSPDEEGAHRFETDVEAAAWVTPSFRIYDPESEMTFDADAEEHGILIVPILTAISKGLLSRGVCGICGDGCHEERYCSRVRY